MQLRIAVLLGGANTEREVSLSSGRAVASALRRLGHRVAEVDSTVPREDPNAPVDAAFEARDARAPSATTAIPTVEATPPDRTELAILRARQHRGVLAPGWLPVLEHADVVYVTVFGDEGESGATQAFLAEHGIPFTGPSAEVCAVTFDKAATKQVLERHGIRTPPWHLVRRDHVADDLAALTLPGPWIVKPVAGGSTIGLSFVADAVDLPAAVAAASAAGVDALVEQFVEGRDFTVGVLGDEVLEVVQTSTDRDLFDYTAKYTPGLAVKKTPADLTPTQMAQVRSLAGRVHHVLDIGNTSSRSDFRLDPEGRFWFFETNPLPGMTPTSSYPISAAPHGYAFPDLCNELVIRALAEHGADRAAEPGPERETPSEPVGA